MPVFRAGRDFVRLEVVEPVVLGLASTLWAAVPGGGAHVDELCLRIEVADGTVEGDPEEELRWDVSDEETRLRAPGIEMTVRPRERCASATVARSLVGLRPALVARFLLEAPVTAMKMVGMQLLHAGAVVGPAGAAVLRGGAGAGKSTLVAACRAAGMRFLGDESLLVEREAPDRLEATLRDLVLTPESARLLGLAAATVPAFSGGERKRRVSLAEPLEPAERLASRAATVLLGPREPGPARLVPISGAEFLETFAAGEIPQERMYGGEPAAVAQAWDGRGTYLMTGALDLPGAVDRIRDLVHAFGDR